MGSPALRARLLGGMTLEIDGQALPPPASTRSESLLAYLLLHRDVPQQRQRLAFLLWPDSQEAQALTNLRKAIHHLRQAWPDLDLSIDVGPRELRWREPGRIWLDVDVFRRAVAAGRLAEAVRTYTGELLEGRYEEWITAERDLLAPMYLDALERLAQEYGQQGRWSDAIRCAERLVGQDPLRETSHRLLITVCSEAGDRPRALRAYHVCATTLERELGVEPAAATRALHERLVGSGGATPTPAATGGLAPMAPFVGRAAEYERLHAVWRTTATGNASMVLVTGEAGVGKSRLVDQLLRSANGVVVPARSYPAEGVIAYGIVTSWLRSQPVAERLPRLEGGHLVELSRLLPELATRVAPAQPLPEPELRRRLFGAIGRALAAAGAPLLLVLDDAQWADAQSLRVVHYLLRAAPAGRILVAATARREELDPAHPLLALAQALRSQDRFTEIPLQRLSRADTALLAEAVTGAPLGPGELDRLYRSSEGNPLFVVESLRSDAPAGAAKVQAVISGRLARLSAPAARLVEVAASAGRSFTAEVLAATSGLTDEEFVRALDELWRRGIVRAHGPNAYDFSHGRIRDAAYAGLSPPRRRQAHLAIAHALEQSGGAAPGALAHHYEQAGATGEAVRWYERAADSAQWVHAHADAVHALERALTLSRRLPAGPQTAAQQLRLLTALPAPLLALEGYGSERTTRVHREAVALADRLGVEVPAPLMWSLALSALTQGEWEAADRRGMDLHARAEQEGDDVLAVESDYIRGIAAYWPGHLARARDRFEAAMRRFRPSRRHDHVLRFGQDPELLVRLRLAHTLWLLGDDEGADRQRDLALAVADRSTHDYSRAVTSVWATILALDRGDETRLREHVRALGTQAGPESPAQVGLAAASFAAFVRVLDGDTSGIAGLHAVREQVLRAAPAPGVPGVVTRVLLAAYSVAGRHEAGLRLADEALGMGRGAQLWEAESRRLRAGFLAALGAPEHEVDAELRRALAVARRQRARAFELRVQGTLAERTGGQDPVIATEGESP